MNMEEFGKNLLQKLGVGVISGMLMSSSISNTNLEEFTFLKSHSQTISQMKNNQSLFSKQEKEELNNLVKEVNPELDRLSSVLDLTISLSHRFVEFVDSKQLDLLQNSVNQYKQLSGILNTLGELSRLKSVQAFANQLEIISQKLESLNYSLKLGNIISTRTEIAHTFESGVTLNEIRKVMVGE